MRVRMRVVKLTVSLEHGTSENDARARARNADGRILFVQVRHDADNAGALKPKFSHSRGGARGFVRSDSLTRDIEDFAG